MITKDQADLIVKNNKHFQSKCDVIDGYEVVQYRYQLASKMDFEEPYQGFEIDANELRGLAYVKQEDGSWERFLMLRKFWEINQTSGSMEKDVSGKKIIGARIKEDGSIIRFVKLPSGRVIAKSMFSFAGKQVEAAQALYDSSPDIRSFIDNCFESDVSPIFELVGPDNQVVLKYETEELRLLQLRSNVDGSYLDVFNSDLLLGYDIPLAGECSVVNDLSYYLNLARTERGHEGYILTFDDGSLIKVKLDEYHSMHGVMDSVVGQEHKVVRMALFDSFSDTEKYSTIDRYLSICRIPDSERKYVSLIAEKVISTINSDKADILSVLSKFKDQDRKAMATSSDVSSHKHKGILMRVKATGCFDAIEELLINSIVKESRTAEKAAHYLRSLGIRCLVKRDKSLAR